MSAYETELGLRLKAYLKELGADLVGYANKERFATSPEMLRPEAQLPECTSLGFLLVLWAGYRTERAYSVGV